MNTLSIPVLIIASISFYVGFYHLLIYFRRRQHREDLTFALLCFTTVFYDAFCIGLYHATSVTEGVQWQRAQFIALAIFVPAFLWFVSDYTREKPGKVIYAYSIYYILVVIVQLVDRSSLTFLVDQPSIKHIVLSHVLAVTYYEATPGSFSIVQGIVGMIASTYILILGIRYYKRGHKRGAMPLILAMGLIYAAGFNDTMVSNGMYQLVYLMEYAYLGIIVVMAYSLSNTVVEAAIAKDALRKSEEWFRSLVETTSDWVWEMDTNGAYTYASPKVRELLGYEPEEIMGQTPFDLMPPNEAKRVNAFFQDSVRSKGPLERVENISRRKDGQLIVLETSGVPFFDNNGRLSGYRGIDRDITERKLAEDALRESEHRFRTLAEASFEGIGLSKQGVLLDLNDQLAQILGYSREELLGTPVSNYVASEHRELVAGFIRSGRQDPYEHLALRKDGTVFPVEIRVRTTRIGNADIRITAIRDITERRQAEEALIRQTALFRNLFERSPEAITIVDQDDRILNVNRSFEKLFGYLEAEAQGHYVNDLIVSEPYLDEAQGITQVSLGDGQVVERETVRCTKDRRPVDVSMVGYPIVVEGRIIGGCGIYRDITERRRAEEKVRQAQLVLESSPVILFRWKAAAGWPVELVSENIAQFGYTPEEFLSGAMPYASIIHPDDLERITREVSEYSSGRVNHFQQEYRILTKGGQVRWTDDQTVIERDAQGRIMHYQGTVMDITERKRAEEERENLIRELTDKNSELERFTYTVSHDLKSPLITIRGFLGFIEQDTQSGNINRLKRDIQRISDATDKMQRLLNELLEISRVGRLTNPSETIPFEDLARAAMDIVNGQLQARGVTVILQPNLPTVYGDRQRLVEVLQNLLDNAAKFMGDQPEPCIEIGQHGEDAERGELVFYIRDNGIGIAPEHHERVFGLFNQLDPKMGGTGVGLALVKRIVEFHGGRVWVESEAGKGSTFYFTLGKADSK